jgi:DNA-binding MarR family transcriptional regulator
LQDYGIGAGQHAYLLALKDNEGMSLEALSSHFFIHKANVTRAVQKLLAAGYIKKERSREDARAWKLYLTKEGDALIPIIRRVLRQWEAAIADGIPAADLREAARVMKALAENAVRL